MGSDWEDFCESNGWNISSENDYERFLESLERGRCPDKNSDLIPSHQHFDSYQEAVNWAKANPGRAIKRAVSGQGFEVKPLSIGKHFQSSQSTVLRGIVEPERLPNRENEIWLYTKRCTEISQYSPQLSDVLTKSSSNRWNIFMRPFSRSKWDQELLHLSNDQLRRLRVLIAVHLENGRQRLRSLAAEMKRDRRMKPGNYGEPLVEVINEFIETLLLDIDRVLNSK